MKQLTIEALQPENPETATGVQCGMATARGIAIPSHMVAPGEEGYRTPTIEDYERHHRESAQRSQQLHGSTAPDSSVRASHQRELIFGRSSFNLSHLNLSPRLLQRLEWRERIRHFTWTFFTMTMATVWLTLPRWSTKRFTISQMTPIWIFPAYPMLIIGPHAAVLSETLEQSKSVAVIVGGFTIQGIGFLVSMMVYSAFIYRLMTQKLPQEATRPGMFVSVGPSGFTVASVIGMATGAGRSLSPNFMGNGPLVAMILKVVASWMGLWIWGLALWFFFISVGAHWSCVGRDKMAFSMTWYSFVFPNTALITATFAVGQAFNARAIQIIGCVMTPLLIVTWFFVSGMMIRAIILKQILWPQKGEDRDEGGFKGPDRKPSAIEKQLSRDMERETDLERQTG
ncbi:MAG: hypothetical protein Q9191_003346 [Dirinaria sp. TL-2023a]